MHSKPSSLLLLDASGFVFRAFYALPALTTSTGLPIGALLGFLRMTLQLLEARTPAALGIVFDSPGPTFRHHQLPSYKQHRKIAPTELIQQIPLIHQACNTLGLACVHAPSHMEADDVLATYALEGGKKGYHVTVVSGDKDLRQVISEQVSLLDPLKHTLTTPATLQETLGIAPAAWAHVQALSGDSSDGIPGVPGIGLKTALALIQTYGTIEAVLANTQSLKPRIASLVTSNRTLLETSYMLARLRVDCPLDPPLDALAWKGLNHEGGVAFCKEYELKSLEKIFASNVKKDAFTVQTYSSKKPAATVSITDQEDDHAVAGLMERIAHHGKLFLYTPLEKNLTLQHVYGWAGEGSVVRFSLPLPPVFASMWHNHFPLKIGYAMLPFLTTLQGFCTKGVHDLQVMLYLYKGAAISSDFFEEAAAFNNPISLAENEPNRVSEAFHAMEAMYGFLENFLLKENLWGIYDGLDRPFLPVLAEMIQAGILLDKSILTEIQTRYTKEIQTLTEYIYTLAGESFNLASPRQVASILFEKLHLSLGIAHKSGDTSTAAIKLEVLAAQGHPIVAAILKWRHLHKLLTTYIAPLPLKVDPQSGRIHPSFSMVKTSTGRLSCAEPNLQNIPIKTPEGHAIRTAFVASPGYGLLSLDYSQIELRIAAHITGDPTLKRAFQEGRDIHLETATGLWGEALALEKRREAKAITFGVLYGMGAYGLANQLKIDPSIAKHYIQSFFARYPALLEYRERIIKEGRTSGFVKTLWGRKCFLTKSHTPQEKDRQAINAPIQGTSADIMKRAMLAIAFHLQSMEGNPRMVLQVHDEVLLEVPESFPEKNSIVLQKAMEYAATLDVPVVIHVARGNNWGQMHS